MTGVDVRFLLDYVRFTSRSRRSQCRLPLPKVTQRRSLAVFESGMVSTFTMVFRRLCMEAGTIRQNRRKSFGWENINSPSETSHRSSQNCPVLLVIMTREGDNDR